MKRALALVCSATLLAIELHYVNHTIDDAFIFFRYAENIARGKGWVFSAGERVEAYTSVLWTAFLALAAWLGAARTKIGLLIVAKIAGVLLSLGTVACTAALARSISPRTQNPLRGGIATLFLCLSAPFALWSVSGLETPLAALLAVLAVYVHSSEADAARAWPRSAIVFALAVLARPELVVLFVVSALFDLARDAWSGSLRARLGRHLRWCVVFLVPCVAHLLWRRAYYGQWLPNTYYAKVGGDPLTWPRGTAYVSAALFDLGLGWLLLAASALFLFARRLPLRAGYLFSLTLGYLLAIALEGGDWMPAFRFAIPILSFVGLLLDAGVSEAYDRISALRFRWLLAAVTCAVLGVAIQCGFNVMPQSGFPSGFRAWSPVPPEQLEAARWINEHLPHEGLLALGEVGIVPYYTELPVLDLFGLADPHIAHLPGIRHHKFDVDYVLARRPKYMLFLGKDAQGKPLPIFTYSEQLLKDARFKQGYRVRHDFHQFTLFERVN